MKVRVFGDKQKEKVSEVFVKLVQHGDSVVLAACGEDGSGFKGGNLLTIDERGIILYGFVSRDLGFDLDKYQHLKVR